MMLRKSSSWAFVLAVLSLFNGSAQAKRLAFHFHQEGAYCKSGTFDVQVNLVKFICSSGDNICRPGDEVIVEGHMEVGNFMPVDITQRVKACKYWGSLCTPVLGYSQNTLGNEWHLYSMYGNETYPNPGRYGFERKFNWPSNTLTDYPWAGFNFNLVADITADDSGNDYTHLRCHAPFTTVDYDSFLENGSSGSGFSNKFGTGRWSLVGLVSLGAFAGLMQRKRRIRETTPAIDLNEVDQQAGCTNFEMMNPSGADAPFVRV